MDEHDVLAERFETHRILGRALPITRSLLSGRLHPHREAVPLAG